jgi:hypothetical protein
VSQKVLRIKQSAPKLCIYYIKMLSISAVTADVSALWGIFFYTDKKEITFSTYTV